MRIKAWRSQPRKPQRFMKLARAIMRPANSIAPQGIIVGCKRGDASLHPRTIAPGALRISRYGPRVPSVLLSSRAQRRGILQAPWRRIIRAPGAQGLGPRRRICPGPMAWDCSLPGFLAAREAALGPSRRWSSPEWRLVVGVALPPLWRASGASGQPCNCGRAEHVR
jgi:hypothetical protein